MASNVVNRPILLKNSSGALAHICRGGQTIPGVAIVDPGSVDRPLCTERNDCSGPEAVLHAAPKLTFALAAVQCSGSGP